MAFLNACYKLLVPEKIKDNDTDHMLSCQAGYGEGRSFVDQVLNLTIFIEAGIQEDLKTLAVFIDLIAAYGTV